MDDEINLLEYWQVIVKRKWIIIAFALIFAVGALVNSLKQPKLYKATSTIMLVDNGGGGLASALSAFSFLGGSSGRGAEAQLTPIINSRTLAEQVASHFDIKEVMPEKFLAKVTDEAMQQRMMTDLLRGSFQPKSMDGLIYLTAVWREPEMAAKIANLYVKELGVFLNKRTLNINFQVIDPPLVPRSPNNRGVKKNVIMGLVLGFLCGCFIALAWEYVENVTKPTSTTRKN